MLELQLPQDAAAHRGDCKRVRDIFICDAALLSFASCLSPLSRMIGISSRCTSFCQVSLYCLRVNLQKSRAGVCVKYASSIILLAQEHTCISHIICYHGNTGPWIHTRAEERCCAGPKTYMMIFFFSF